MKHGSLFSGIGGFDLAAEWMGWENVFHCEWNEFGQKVLKYHFPNADSYGDITQTDFTKYEGTIDIISGGFPCQPFSTAGQRFIVFVCKYNHFRISVANQFAIHPKFSNGVVIQINEFTGTNGKLVV